MRSQISKPTGKPNEDEDVVAKGRYVEASSGPSSSPRRSLLSRLLFKRGHDSRRVPTGDSQSGLLPIESSVDMAPSEKFFEQFRAANPTSQLTPLLPAMSRDFMSAYINAFEANPPNGDTIDALFGAFLTGVVAATNPNSFLSQTIVDIQKARQSDV